MLILSIFALLSYLDFGYCYKILAVLPFPSKSHYAIPDPLMVRLAELGHDVTVYNPYVKKHKIPNYKEIDISKCFPAPTHILTMDTMSSLASNSLNSLILMFMFTPKFDEIDKCKPIVDLLNSTEKYDLFITESFTTDVMLMFAHKFQTPVITYIPNVMLTWLSNRMGNPDNPSYVPNILSGFLSNMSFLERVENTVLYVLSLFLYRVLTTRSDDAVIHKYLGSSAPPMTEMIRNTSLLFVNMNAAINPPLPLVPGVVDIGGIHIKPAANLPKVRIIVMTANLLW